MLMNIKCSAVTSIQVFLKFDDESTKNVVVSKGDLIEVEFNQNGLRKHVEGKVLKICTNSGDPKGWYIIVDSSDDFESSQAKFSPMNILDIEIIQRADAVRYIETPSDCTGIRGLRVVKGRLQYTIDGFNWNELYIDKTNVLIKDEVGTVPDGTYTDCNCGEDPFDDNFVEGQDVIKDESY